MSKDFKIDLSQDEIKHCNDDKSNNLNLSLSSRKSIKKLRAWCGECYQFFEFGPFAKVCQQHILKGKCNIYECEKKYFNKYENKICIRKFPNKNSENRHTYCLDEEEIKTWDSKYKIQNYARNKKHSEILNFSSEKLKRKTSFDSLILSELNLDLQENSRNFEKNDKLLKNFKLLDNFGTIIKNTQNSIEKNKSNKNKIDDTEILEKLGKKYFNTIKSNNLISIFNENENKINIKNIKSLSKKNKLKIKNKKILKLNKLSLKPKNLKVIDEKNKNEIFEHEIKFDTDISKIDKKENRLKLNKYFEIDYDKNDNDLRSLKKEIKSPILKSDVKSPIKSFEIEKNNKIQNKNLKRILNFSKKKKNDVSSIKDGQNNVNGLIDQIGNLKFENSRNDSILEDDVLIKQFNNIYFNYNQGNKNNNNQLNNSNLNIFDQKLQIEEDFELLDKFDTKIEINIGKTNEDILSFDNEDKISDNKIFLNIFKSSEQEKINLTNKILKENSQEKFDLVNNNLNKHNLINVNQTYKNITNDNFFEKNFNWNCGINNENKKINELTTKNIFIEDGIENKILHDINLVQNKPLLDEFLVKKLKKNQNLSEKNNLNELTQKNLISNKKKLKDKKEICNINTQEDKLNESIDRDKKSNKLESNLLETKESEFKILSENNIIIKDVILLENEEIVRKNISLDYSSEKINDKNKIISLNDIDENKIKNINKQNLEISTVNFYKSFFQSLEKENISNFKVLNEKKNVFSPDILEIKSEELSIVSNFEKKLIKKNYKIKDDFNIDEIFNLINKNTGIPTKFLNKLKDSMKKKGIFNARILRLFKKKKEGWNFLQKEYSKYCSQIEVVGIYLEEILEELKN